MNFASSTHRAHWLFSKDDLLKKRQEVREKAVADHAKKMQSSDLSAPVTTEEEGKLLRFYQEKIASLCAELKYPLKVKATALVYYKRFFLMCSVMNFDPVKIMLTCIYLAGKIEEAYIGAEDFCRILKQDIQAVLRTEVPLLQGMRFELVVHSPYRALVGFLQDIEDLRKKESKTTVPETDPLITASNDVVAQCKGASYSAIDALMMTDAPLIHPPGQLALAALRSGFRRRGIKLGPYLEAAVNKAVAKTEVHGVDQFTAYQQVMSNLDAIDQLGMAGVQKADVGEVQAIDKKLKAWRKPATDPNSDAAKRGVETTAAAGSDKDKNDRRYAKLKARKDQQQAEERATELGLELATS